MAGKEFVFGFKIAAALQGNFNAAFNGASSQILKLNEKAKEYKETIKSLKNAEKAGIITKESYANAMAKLEPAYQKIISRQKEYMSVQGKVNMAQAAMLKHGVNLLQFKEMGSTMMDLVKPAIEFESAMANVKKVVDFDTPLQFKEMSKDILDLSQKIPITAEGLAKIVASGGQSGIAREELTAFAEAAAKMGVAFDITADQAGDMMAKWRTAFKMNQSQVVELADKINYLGNTTAASAPLISDVVRRIGPLGEIGGVASGEIAALGASMVGAGVESEVAATGIKNMILGMVAGESATKSQSAAFAQLGLDSTEMAKRMQTDAKGAIIDVLSKIQSLDKYEQASVLKNLFGSESLGAIAPLLSNLNSLQDNLDKVADKTQYTGSMEGEFSARSATTANSIQLMENRINMAKIAIGNGLLPIVTPLVEKLGALAGKAGEIANEYPNLTAGIIGGAGAVALLSAGVSGAMWVYNGFKYAMIGTKLALLSFKETTIALSVAQRTGAAVTGLITTAQWAWNVAMSANPIGVVIAGIGLLIGAGYLLYNNWDVIKSWFTTIWDNPSAALDQFITFLYDKFGNAFNWLAEKWDWISSVFSKPITASVKTEASVDGNGNALATGGIFHKGAFLTTFAEKSGESAIPHTPNSRNIGLLAKTNEIMGNPLGVGQAAIGDATGNQLGVGQAPRNEIAGNPLGVGQADVGSITATFAPNINISGNADAGTVQQIQQVMQETLADFERKLAALQSQKRRVAFD